MAGCCSPPAGMPSRLTSPRSAAWPRSSPSPCSPEALMRAYEYRHVITFEDTNLVGNVYFTRYLGWQGRCRELFLREHAPSVLEELARDLRLVTTRVSCDYFAELRAFDEVLVAMTLRAASQTR